MTLTVQSPVANGHTQEWAALHLAIGLYVTREASLGQASEIAGLTYSQFQDELGSRKIPLNYSMEDLEVDLAAVRELSGK